ncbi:hypothetical protein [Granulicella mallensis]|uniref:Uncharacterized protein n=1 Tax=Granulicella mallensis (strain ATCC BAA-1857 / DSM 23137 / MP5ACTX8) TaxID=682795 RepID=G8NR76_GRAMM|nr:hypothetical protein [Granulicella mallensis]AEU36154.1 hypothetical protein AciX8_1817 [Granulicella mallensis MP5ACTX8]
MDKAPKLNDKKSTNNQQADSPPDVRLPMETGKPFETQTRADKPAQNEKDTNEKLLDRVKVGERWMIILTALIFSVSAFQAYESWSNNRATSTQVDRLIAAANRVDDAAESFSTSARKISNGVGDAVEKLDTQANTFKSQYTETQRAFVFVKSIDTTYGLASNGEPAYSWDITLENSGSTNARGLVLQRNCGTGEQFKLRSNELLDFSQFLGEKQQLTIGPHSMQTISECGALASLVLHTGIVKDPGSWYSFGRLTYKDIFGTPHITEYCYRYNFHMPRDGNFAETLYMTPCEGKNSQHNCADEDCKVK